MIIKIRRNNREPKDTRDTAILFDMDGVLVDVRDSYRKTIQETVKFLSGTEASLAEIQKLKEKGGFNNDWALTEAILHNRNIPVPKKQILEKFQEIYWGTEDNRGLIDREKWLLQKNNLNGLHESNCLGIVTGRPKEETLYTLQKFEVQNAFDVVVTLDDYPPEKSKPDPYPIKLALEKLNKPNAIYIGDSVDDIDAAKRAGIRAFGCIPYGMSSGPFADLLIARGAEIVLYDVNDVIKILTDIGQK